MRIASDFYGRLAGVMLTVLAVAARIVTGSDSRINEQVITDNQRKAANYSAGLDIPSGRQMPHQI